jgi:hypothetical protein
MTDVDEDIAALYRIARAQESPTREDRIAVRAGVASALAVTTLVTSAHATAGGLATAAQAAKLATLGKAIAWLAVGAALGGATSSVAWVAFSTPAAQRPAVAAVSASPAPALVTAGDAPSSVARPAVAADRGPSSATSAQMAVRGSIELPRAARRDVGRNAPAASRSARSGAARVERRPALATPSLTAESEGLLAIQRALSGGDASRALQMVGEQDSQFRAGALAEERGVVRVLALCAAGQSDQARLARDRFIVAYPSSPHAKRVLESCASHDGSRPSGHGE